jgi:hypothetical protein
MLWPLGALLAVFFAMPMELFSGWGADHRLLPAIGLMLVGSLRLRDQRWRAAPIVSTAIVGLVAVRVVAVALEWRKADAGYAEYVRAFDAVADGSRMFFAFGEPRNLQQGLRPYQHLPTLVLMKRHVFVPSLFAGNSGVFPLRHTAEGDALRKIARSKDTASGRVVKWADVVAAYDYIFLVDERLLNEPEVRRLVPVFKGERVSVYRTPSRQEAAWGTRGDSR